MKLTDRKLLPRRIESGSSVLDLTLGPGVFAECLGCLGAWPVRVAVFSDDPLVGLALLGGLRPLLGGEPALESVEHGLDPAPTAEQVASAGIGFLRTASGATAHLIESCLALQLTLWRIKRESAENVARVGLEDCLSEVALRLDDLLRGPGRSLGASTDAILEVDRNREISTAKQLAEHLRLLNLGVAGRKAVRHRGRLGVEDRLVNGLCPGRRLGLLQPGVQVRDRYAVLGRRQALQVNALLLG